MYVIFLQGGPAFIHDLRELSTVISVLGVLVTFLGIMGVAASLVTKNMGGAMIGMIMVVVVVAGTIVSNAGDIAGPFWVMPLDRRPAPGPSSLEGLGTVLLYGVSMVLWMAVAAVSCLIVWSLYCRWPGWWEFRVRLFTLVFRFHQWKLGVRRPTALAACLGFIERYDRLDIPDPVSFYPYPDDDTDMLDPDLLTVEATIPAVPAPQSNPETV